MAKITATERAGGPGRRPASNAAHTAALRSIVRERPRCSLDELTRQLFVRTGVKVHPLLPKAFPPRQAIYMASKRWAAAGVFETLHDRLHRAPLAWVRLAEARILATRLTT